MFCVGVLGIWFGGCYGDSGGFFVCKDFDGFWVF